MNTNPYRQAILDLLDNYSLCGYPLDLLQIHRMLTVQVGMQELRGLLEKYVEERYIIEDDLEGWYTRTDSEINFAYRKKRIHVTKHKKHKVSKFLALLYLFPWVDLVLLTGSCAIENAKESDDVDLLIVTRPHTMFICRMYTFLLARTLGLGRKRLVEEQPGAVCANIWIDGSDLTAPQSKVNVYSAREIVNAVVLFDRGIVYEKLIGANKWIHEKLPNWGINTIKNSISFHDTAWFVRKINEYAGRFQLWYMRPHITQEIVGMTQLWLHPRLHQ